MKRKRPTQREKLAAEVERAIWDSPSLHSVLFCNIDHDGLALATKAAREVILGRSRGRGKW